MKQIFVLLLLLVGCTGLSANKTSSESREIVLLVGKPIEISFVMLEGDLPENLSDSNIYFGSVYRVRIEIDRVFYGSVDDDVVVLNLIATHLEYLAGAQKLFVLLEKKTTGELSVVGWDKIEQDLCLPQTVIDEYNLTDIFETSYQNGHDRCIDI